MQGNNRILKTNEINIMYTQKLDKLNKMWFVDKCFIVGGFSSKIDINDKRMSADLIIIPKKNNKLFKFNIFLDPIDETFAIDEAIQEAENHFNIFRRIYWNLKIFLSL